jgi:hypothetical protein
MLQSSSWRMVLDVAQPHCTIEAEDATIDCQCRDSGRALGILLPLRVRCDFIVVMVL